MNQASLSASEAIEAATRIVSSASVADTEPTHGHVFTRAEIRMQLEAYSAELRDELAAVDAILARMKAQDGE